MLGMGQTPQSPGAGREYGAAGSSGAAAGDPEGPTESAAGGRATKVSVSRLWGSPRVHLSESLRGQPRSGM